MRSRGLECGATAEALAIVICDSGAGRIERRYRRWVDGIVLYIIAAGGWRVDVGSYAEKHICVEAPGFRVG